MAYKRVENLNFCFIGYKKDKKLRQLSPYWQVRRETVKRETAKSDRLYRLASSICHIILERMEVLSSNQSNLFLTLLIFSITDIIWYFISSLCSCRLSEYNGFQQESSCYLGHCTQIKFLSLMIIYQLLCSPTYVHLCKCLILVWNKERLKAEIDRGFVIMLLCRIFLRLYKPFLCNGLLDFETCLDIYISRAYKVGISITSYYWLLHDKLSRVSTVLSNLKVKPGFLKDVIITFTLCPVFADSRCRKKKQHKG